MACSVISRILKLIREEKYLWISVQMGAWAGSPSFYVRLLRSGLSTFHTKPVFWIRDAIFLLSEINRHSQQKIKWSMCFSNLLKVSRYGQILDISTLKHESHHLRLRASPCEHPTARSVLKHEDACSLQLILKREQSSLWGLGKTIPPFSGSLSQEGPEATCDSSLFSSCVLRMGRDFCQSLFPSQLKESCGFKGKPCSLHSVHWLLKCCSQVWVWVCRISEARAHVFDLTSTVSRFKQHWSSEVEVEDLAHTRKQRAQEGSWLYLHLVGNCWKPQSRVTI